MLYKIVREQKALLVVLLLFFANGCGNKTEFLELERRTQIIDGRYYLDVLVSNPSDETEIIKQQMLAFCNSKMKELNDKKANADIGRVTFYKKTNCTSYFVNHDETPTAAFDLRVKELQLCNDEIGSITELRGKDKVRYVLSIHEKDGGMISETLKMDGNIIMR